MIVLTGKGHIISGSIFAIDAYLCHYMLSQVETSDIICAVSQYIDQCFNSFVYYESELNIVKYAFFGLSVLLYYIGLLFPDIDTKSTISNFLHFKLPGYHRGITHSIWTFLLFFIIGCFYCYPLRFFALGIFVHDCVDGFSSAGWVLFYPFGDYKIYHNIICTKRKHPVLYSSTAAHSESVCLLVFVLISILILSIVYYVSYHICF